MVTSVSVAQQATAGYPGARDQLTPGRGYTYLMGGAVACRRWSCGVWALPLVWVPILVLGHLLIAGVSHWAFTIAT